MTGCRTGIYKRPLSVFKKFGCYFKLKFDSALGGECHACRYCYRTNLLNNIGLANGIKYSDVDYLEDFLEESRSPLNRNKSPPENEVLKYMKGRMPIRLGSMCDPFDPDENIRRITIYAIGLLNQYNYPYMVFTKSECVASPEVITKLKESGQNVLVHMSLSNMENKKGLIMEPKAPDCEKRFNAIKTLFRENIPVVLRIAPIMLGFNDDDIITLMQAFKSVGGKKVIIEELRVGDDFKKYLERNYPLVMKYFPNSKDWHYYRYDKNIISPIFKGYVNEAKKLGLQIGICGNHELEKELCNNDNCCLFDNPPMKIDFVR